MTSSWRKNVYLCEVATVLCTLLLGFPFYVTYLVFMGCFDRNTRIMGLIATGAMSAGAIPILVIPGEIIRVVSYKWLYEGKENVETLFFGSLEPANATEEAA